MSVEYCICGEALPHHDSQDYDEYVPHTCSMSLTCDEYQDLAARTRNEDLTKEERTIVAALGLSGEAGECADLVKKAFGHGHKLARGKLKAELGDVLWYIAEMCSAQGWTLGEVAHHNVAKLRHRYPEGFDSERSIARKDLGYRQCATCGDDFKSEDLALCRTCRRAVHLKTRGLE